MPGSLKVMPVTPDDVGLVHPIDGALAAMGSLWSYDVFTVRHLDAGVIRRFEAGADAIAEPAPSSRTAPASPEGPAATTVPEAGQPPAPAKAAKS